MNYTYTLIIPHYNIPDKLRRLLNSVPRRDDLQIIVVDDMSTKHLDELEKVRQDFPYVEWYNTGTNGGGGKARNIGLDHAKGDYVFFADSDDYFLPELTNLLDKYSTAEEFPDIIFCNADAVIEEIGERSHRIDHLNNIHKLNSTDPKRSNLLMRYYLNAPWCKFVKREVIYRNDIRCSETPVFNDVKYSYMVGWYCKESECYSTPIYRLTQSPCSVTYRAGFSMLPIKAKVHAEKYEFLKKRQVQFIDPDAFSLIYLALTRFRIHELKECIKIFLNHGMSALTILKGTVNYAAKAIAIKLFKADPKIFYM